MYIPLTSWTLKFIFFTWWYVAWRYSALKLEILIHFLEFLMFLQIRHFLQLLWDNLRLTWRQIKTETKANMGTETCRRSGSLWKPLEISDRVPKSQQFKIWFWQGWHFVTFSPWQGRLFCPFSILFRKSLENFDIFTLTESKNQGNCRQNLNKNQYLTGSIFEPPAARPRR